MKKLLIAALISAPLVGFTQGKTPTTPPATGKESPAATKEDPESKALVYKPENLYADIVITSIPNRGLSVRMDFGRDLVVNLEDKELIAEITMLKQIPFPTIPDALNYLSSKGWHQVTQYTVTTQSGTETRLVVEKRISKRFGDTGTSSPQRPPIVAKEPPVKPADGGTKPPARDGQKPEKK
jgi:hypothetical protein